MSAPRGPCIISHAAFKLISRLLLYKMREIFHHRIKEALCLVLAQIYLTNPANLNQGTINMTTIPERLGGNHSADLIRNHPSNAPVFPEIVWELRYPVLINKDIYGIPHNPPP